MPAVRRFRELAEAAGATSLQLARRRLPGDYQQMIDNVEVTVAAQPLPRLQTVGATDTNFPFLYNLTWGPRAHFTVTRLRAAGPRGPEVQLRPGAGDELVQLGPLIRPLIEIHWTRMVAQLNDMARAEEDLHQHLFGSERLHTPGPLPCAGVRPCQWLGREGVNRFAGCGVIRVRRMVVLGAGLAAVSGSWRWLSWLLVRVPG